MLIVFAAVAVAIVALWTVSLPDGATYEEYQRLEKGMSRQQVAAIIGEGDYWHHYEGERDVTNWVNKDGTYVQAVFDKGGSLVDAAWKTGWDPAWEKQQ